MRAFEFKREQKRFFSSRVLILLGFSLSIMGCAKDKETPPAPVYDNSINTPLPGPLSPITSTAGSGVTDVDGNTYTTVVLGNGQEWMAGNLKTTKYSNNDPIPDEIGIITSISMYDGGTSYKSGFYNNISINGGIGIGATADIRVNSIGVVDSVALVTPGINYIQGNILTVNDSLLSDTLIGFGFKMEVDATTWNNLASGVWSQYNFDSQYDNPYGKIYNYFVVADARNVCPTGWHVPSDVEWNALISYLDPSANLSTIGSQSTTAGGRMKSKGKQYWAAPNTYATNESGFSALPAGSRDSIGDFNYISASAGFWTSTELDANNAYSRDVSYGSGEVYRRTNNKNGGYSIRCLKD